MSLKKVMSKWFKIEKKEEIDGITFHQDSYQSFFEFARLIRQEDQ